MKLFRLSVAILVVASLFCGCAHSARKDAGQPLTISNVDVTWDANIAGLWPTLNGPSKAFLTNFDTKVVSALIGSLSDTSRYIAAHVFAYVHFKRGIPIHYRSLERSRSGILADNSVVVPDGHQRRLMKKWNQWYANRAE